MLAGWQELGALGLYDLRCPGTTPSPPSSPHPSPLSPRTQHHHRHQRQLTPQLLIPVEPPVPASSQPNSLGHASPGPLLRCAVAAEDLGCVVAGCGGGEVQFFDVRKAGACAGSAAGGSTSGVNKAASSPLARAVLLDPRADVLPCSLALKANRLATCE